MTDDTAENTLPEPILSLYHLQAELARIQMLVAREVARWQAAGQDIQDRFRGLHISDAEAEQLVARPLATSWGQAVHPDARAAADWDQARAEAERRVEEAAAQAHGQGCVPRLERLAMTFGLDRFDLDTLLICLTPALDLRFERLYAYLQDDVTRKKPSIGLVLDLLAEPGIERLPLLLRFGDAAPLFGYYLVERVPEPGTAISLVAQPLAVDPAVVSWLLGGYQPHAELGTHATLLHPRPNDTDELLAAALLPDLERIVALGDPVAVAYGSDRAGQQAAARVLAARAGRPLLAVDLAGVIGDGTAPLRAVRLALRDARLAGAMPLLEGWDACLGQGGGNTDGRPPADLLAEMEAHPGPIVVAGQSAWQAGGLDRARPFFWLEFPVPGYTQRRALWAHYARPALPPAADGGPRDEDGGLTSLAGQFALTAGQIRDAVAAARDAAAGRDFPLCYDDLTTAARAYSNPRLMSLARKIQPRYTWSDIVLPDDQLALLREIVATVRGRPLVLEEWGVGKKLASSAGVTILFSGPPGTGKTMAAEVMSAELGLDLYKIDLSTIVSKYIGETEKNLERIFGEAQASNAILFFDEADAIFGKRSEVKDAHDRYANIEVSYLLQRMEAYEGVTILATNLRANLDEAFTRRLQFAVDFPFPDELYRLRIWQTLLPPGVPREPDLDFEPLARRFKLAGGNIRNVLVSAAYLAAADGGRLGMRHLLHGTRRELQKMGRLVSDKDLALLGESIGR